MFWLIDIFIRILFENDEIIVAVVVIISCKFLDFWYDYQVLKNVNTLL